MKTGFLGVFLIVTFLTISFLSTGAFCQEDITTVRDSAFSEHERPPVAFLHEQHNETAEIYDCAVCHHVYEDGKKLEYETSEDRECSACHADSENSGDYRMDLIKTYHDNCKGCHLEKKAGPVLCSQCHER